MCQIVCWHCGRGHNFGLQKSRMPMGRMGIFNFVIIKLCGLPQLADVSAKSIKCSGRAGRIKILVSFPMSRIKNDWIKHCDRPVWGISKDWGINCQSFYFYLHAQPKPRDLNRSLRAHKSIVLWSLIFLHPTSLRRDGCNSFDIVCVSVCVCVCPSRYPSWTDRHTDLNFGMEVKWKGI